MMNSNTEPTDDRVDDAFDRGHDADQQESAGQETSADATPSILAERDRYLELARRTQADFENYQKRVRRDTESERRYAYLPILGDLLPVLDNLERALQSAPTDESSQGFVAGVRLLHKQWLDVLDKHHITKVPTDGQPFDVNIHEAVMQQPSANHPPMTVLHTVRTGYQLHDRIVRPAQVIVSATPTS
jgi:molecular chaperone GrpE